MHFFRLTVVALVAIAAGQYSDELPAYSVESWCNKVAVIGGSGSEVIYRTCVTKERSGYDQLKDQWATLPSPNPSMVRSGRHERRRRFLFNTARLR